MLSRVAPRGPMAALAGLALIAIASAVLDGASTTPSAHTLFVAAPFAAGDGSANIPLTAHHRVVIRWVALRSGVIQSLRLRVRTAGATGCTDDPGTGYGGGTGGTWVVTTERTLANGQPDAQRTLARSTLSPCQSKSYDSISIPLGLRVVAGVPYATVVRNGDPMPNRNFSSLNFLYARRGLVRADTRPSPGPCDDAVRIGSTRCSWVLAKLRRSLADTWGTLRRRARRCIHPHLRGGLRKRVCRRATLLLLYAHHGRHRHEIPSTARRHDHRRRSLYIRPRRCCRTGGCKRDGKVGRLPPRDRLHRRSSSTDPHPRWRDDHACDHRWAGGLALRRQYAGALETHLLGSGIRAPAFLLAAPASVVALYPLSRAGKDLLGSGQTR